MYLLALLIFGTNGILASFISLGSSQIVLMRTWIGGAILTCLVFIKGGFDKAHVCKEWIWLMLGGILFDMN